MTAPDVDQPLRDRVAIVTGAASGIGRAAALALGRDGATVAVVDRSGDGAASTVAALANGRARAVVADCGEESDIVRVVEETVAAYGRLDVVYANAATQWFGTAEECTPAQWDATFAVNLRGVWLLAREALPRMAGSGGGVFLATSSDCAIRTSPRAAAYTAAKAGLNGLVRSIAVDFGPRGIRANVVTPGVTDTPGLRRLYSEGGRSAEDGIGRAAALSPLGRIGRPEDLGDVVAFLASDGARFITGANIMVDGGMTVTYGAD